MQPTEEKMYRFDQILMVNYPSRLPFSSAVCVAASPQHHHRKVVCEGSQQKQHCCRSSPCEHWALPHLGSDSSPLGLSLSFKVFLHIWCLLQSLPPKISMEAAQLKVQPWESTVITGSKQKFLGVSSTPWILYLSSVSQEKTVYVYMSSVYEMCRVEGMDDWENLMTPVSLVILPYHPLEVARMIVYKLYIYRVWLSFSVDNKIRDSLTFQTPFNEESLMV